MARAFYGSRISDNIAKTPEGFLICYNVPIGRTGEYKYLSCEVGLDDSKNPNEIVSVYRDDEAVFDKKTLASFEGKALTDEHPVEDVDTNNWQMYSKGEITNVRKGDGEYSDCIIADLIVRDPIVISEIESGIKREVSSGYSCDYVMKDGKIYQTNIIGNHVALVKNGRAGSRVSIKDTATVNDSRLDISIKLLKLL